MRFCTSSNNRGLSRLTILMAGLLLCACQQSDQPQRHGVTLGSFSSSTEDSRLRLSGNLDLRLSKPMKEALSNGITLTLSYHLRSREPNRSFPRINGQARQSWRISYLPLSENYALENLETSQRQTFPRLRHLLAALHRVEASINLDYPPEPGHRVEFKAEIDLRQLPSPMRIPAWLSSDWHLSDRWKPWQPIPSA